MVTPLNGIQNFGPELIVSSKIHSNQLMHNFASPPWQHSKRQTRGVEMLLKLFTYNLTEITQGKSNDFYPIVVFG